MDERPIYRYDCVTPACVVLYIKTLMPMEPFPCPICHQAMDRDWSYETVEARGKGDSR